jgi:hypothetical protein
MMVYEDPGQEEGGKLINEAAAAAVNSGYSFDGLDLFGVSLVTGYDIGIASSVRSHAVLLTPADWRTRLGYFGLIGPEGLDAVGLLIRAVITGSAQEVESRLAAGSDPNGKSPAGDTPLIYAAFKGRADAVKVLAAHGADANYRSPQGVTPLFVAVDRGDLPTVKALLEAGADPGSRFGNETVAEHAGKLGRPDVLALLTQAAASRPAAAVPVP